MMQARFRRWGLAALACAPLAALASAPVQSTDPKEWQLNMGRGVTQTANIAYDAHMMALWVCVVIGVLVFGAMAWAMFRFRKSKGAVAAQFSHNTTAEIIWTVVPIIALVAMAWPATHMLIKQYDTRDSAMTIKVTGYQWLWKYEYRGEGVELTSRLARDSERIRQSGEQPDMTTNPHYLLDVDNALVLPVDTKIRFVITADDVIHAWWVPALGWKQDAIPGIVNEAWTDIKQPGVYRGQCAELCGKDHGFMPIVVRAVPKAEFATWLAAQKAKNAPPPTAASPATAIDTASGTASGTGPARPAAPDPTTDPAPQAPPVGGEPNTPDTQTDSL
jgi:cytochrome c oxidase subunit II